MSRSTPTRLVVFSSLLILFGCGDSERDFAGPAKREARPVELVLQDNGLPDPAVLAAEQILRRGNGEEPETLDPHLTVGLPGSRILRDLFEGLTTESPDGEIVPGVAQGWNISRDARTYTFYLRRGLVWSNGDPLTAEDFLFSLRRAADPRTAASAARMLLPVLNAREVLAGELPVEELGVSLLDEFTLQITLTGPTPYFLGLLAHPIAFPVNRRNLEQFGDQFSRPGNLVSNGAYAVVKWVPRVEIVLQKNPLFREAERTLVEQVHYYPIEDHSTELKAFRAGEIDWTNEVPNNQFGWLQNNYPDELVVSPWMGSYFFGFNLTREPFIDNPSLRMALILAIDRQILTEKVTQFGEQPSYALVPPGIDGYVPFSPEYADWSQAERNHEARRLYEQAGYSADYPLRLEIRYNTSENHKKIALAIASMWKQVLGVNTTLVNEEFRVFLQNREQKVLTQVFRAGWISDYNDPYSFLEMFRTGHGRNDYGYSNSSFDALLDQVGTERVRVRRERLMFEAERVLMSDHVIIPVYTYVTKRLVSPQLGGWRNNVMDRHPTRYMFKLRWREPGQGGRTPEDAGPTATVTPASPPTPEAEGPTPTEPAGAAPSVLPEPPAENAAEGGGI